MGFLAWVSSRAQSPQLWGDLYPLEILKLDKVRFRLEREKRDFLKIEASKSETEPLSPGGVD